MTKHRKSYQGYVKLLDGDFKTYINMAVDKVELNQIGKDFCYEIAQFPNTVGAIDGKYMRIKSPSDEHIVNLKNYNYMNIQVVCNATLNFSKRWPSSMGVPMILSFRI